LQPKKVSNAMNDDNNPIHNKQPNNIQKLKKNPPTVQKRMLSATEENIKQGEDRFKPRAEKMPPPSITPKRPERQVKVAPNSNISDSGRNRSVQFKLNFSKLRDLGFITPLNRRSRLNEEMRLIKRRLIQKMTLNDVSHLDTNQSTGMEHVILVTSSKPGEGKSFFTLNLALSIAVDEGYNVLLVDADVARPALTRLLESNITTGLTDLLRDPHLDMSDVLQREKNYPLTFLAAGSGVASATNLFAGRNMKYLVDDIAQRYPDRIIIFDAPPLLASTEPLVLAQYAGQIAFIIDSQTTPKVTVEAALNVLDRHDNVNLVLNKTRISLAMEQFGAYYEAYTRGKNRV
jgi:exopolysaccharide/PEP-CTERM locus tyrosine autokinase